MLQLELICFSNFLIDHDSQLEDDEQLALAMQESLNVESPPRYGYGNIYQPAPVYYPMGGLRYITFVLIRCIVLIFHVLGCLFLHSFYLSALFSHACIEYIL